MGKPLDFETMEVEASLVYTAAFTWQFIRPCSPPGDGRSAPPQPSSVLNGDSDAQIQQLCEEIANRCSGIVQLWSVIGLLCEFIKIFIKVKQ